MKFLDRLEEWLVTFLMAGATSIIFVSVVHRYLASNTGRFPEFQNWLLSLNFGLTQELCIIMFVWMAKFGAAYGVLVLVFQHGVGKGLLGVTSADGIENVVPLLLFVILFGLSMDYHVFILSRIRETFDRGASMDDAVAHGIKSTAGVVTSAAVVMVAVFSVFGALSLLGFKQFGVGLAAAVLIDATIVRAVLLPATMKLLGDWNWYLPRWLEWLPRLEPAEPKTRPESGTASVPV